MKLRRNEKRISFLLVVVGLNVCRSHDRNGRHAAFLPLTVKYGVFRTNSRHVIPTPIRDPRKCTAGIPRLFEATKIPVTSFVLSTLRSKMTTRMMVSITSLKAKRDENHIREEEGDDDEEDDDDDDDDDETDAIENVLQDSFSILSKPLSFGGILNPPMALGYPLVIFLGAVFLMPLTSFLILLTFGTFSWLGRTVVLSEYEKEDDDDDDDDMDASKVDLLALGAATVISGLLTPITVSFDTINFNHILGLAIPLMVLAIGLSRENDVNAKHYRRNPMHEDDNGDHLDLSGERQLMDIWDDKLQSQSRKESGKN